MSRPAIPPNGLLPPCRSTGRRWPVRSGCVVRSWRRARRTARRTSYGRQGVTGPARRRTTRVTPETSVCRPVARLERGTETRPRPSVIDALARTLLSTGRGSPSPEDRAGGAGGVGDPACPCTTTAPYGGPTSASPVAAVDRVGRTTVADRTVAARAGAEAGRGQTAGPGPAGPAVSLTGGNRNDVAQLLPVVAERRQPHGTGLGISRYVVERTIASLHGFRRLHIRWERRDDIHEPLLGLAACLITYRNVRRLCQGFSLHSTQRDQRRIHKASPAQHVIHERSQGCVKVQTLPMNSHGGKRAAAQFG